MESVQLFSSLKALITVSMLADIKNIYFPTCHQFSTHPSAITKEICICGKEYISHPLSEIYYHCEIITGLNYWVTDFPPMQAASTF